MKKGYVWLVIKERYTDYGDSEDILGVFDTFEKAVERVNDEFDAMEDEYIEKWGDNYEGDNHNNGFAELHVNTDWDETKIYCLEYEVNRFYND